MQAAKYNKSGGVMGHPVPQQLNLNLVGTAGNLHSDPAIFAVPQSAKNMQMIQPLANNGSQSTRHSRQVSHNN
jgi:hypothetical protein